MVRRMGVCGIQFLFLRHWDHELVASEHDSKLRPARFPLHQNIEERPRAILLEKGIYKLQHQTLPSGHHLG